MDELDELKRVIKETLEASPEVVEVTKGRIFSHTFERPFAYVTCEWCGLSFGPYSGEAGTEAELHAAFIADAATKAEAVPCVDSHHLFVVARLTTPTPSATLAGEFTPEAARAIKAAFPCPSPCPACGFTHPTALWVRKGNGLRCANCGTPMPVDNAEMG